ncbi:protein of unknown function [Pararobbsia alpina]
MYVLDVLAERTGLEPATPGVTGRYSNQLNYHSPHIGSFVIVADAEHRPKVRTRFGLIHAAHRTIDDDRTGGR